MHRIFALLFSLALVSGCAAPSPPEASPSPTPDAAFDVGSLCGSGADGTVVVARLRDAAVTEGDLAAAIARLPARARDRYMAVAPRRVLAERLLEERLLCRAAAAAGLDGSAAARRAAESAVAEFYVDHQEATAASDEAVQAFYAANADRYTLEMVDAGHIVLANEADAKAVLRELRAGAQFEDLAIGRSLDRKSGPAGGRVGWVGRGRMDATWVEAALSLSVGGFSEPIKTTFGWHIIQIYDRKATQPLSEVRDGIDRRLRRDAQSALLASLRGDDHPFFAGPLAATEALPTDPTPEALPTDPTPEALPTDSNPEAGPTDPTP